MKEIIKHYGDSLVTFCAAIVMGGQYYLENIVGLEPCNLCLLQKYSVQAVFLIFHQIFFLAFNSRDITMLWVLNLFSRSSSTKLWKRILKKMSQKICFDTQSWQVVRLPHIDSVGKIKFESEILMKTFFYILKMMIFVKDFN